MCIVTASCTACGSCKARAASVSQSDLQSFVVIAADVLHPRGQRRHPQVIFVFLLCMSATQPCLHADCTSGTSGSWTSAAADILLSSVAAIPLALAVTWIAPWWVFACRPCCKSRQPNAQMHGVCCTAAPALHPPVIGAASLEACG
jgi:hypothetical protein